ncbi:uncharacterized protein LOC120271626 [Dioscorea cayenensis subsp. rotundata]|uniref:Uncharacterized protein LOC120271626 n=1 Tax=Dioscorea cayennensis subsp. rotundata TaxID=55577 RepID=A0AB40C6W0_DIOCR|nr:uncharacterized protein LOC120271626 [Dioscorea cayenensis subsp. rotundata]
MEVGNCANDSANARSAKGKRGTPNKRWKAKFDNFLIPVLVEQANKGLKCDKSFKRVAFAHAASAVNTKFNTDFTAENVENHYRTLKARYVEIKKARDLSGAGWDNETKMITLDPIVAFSYTEAHPAAKAFINKPIENYEGLRIICGEDSATGSYATSLYSDFGEKTIGDKNNENENSDSPVDQPNSDDDGAGNSAPPIARSPATSSSMRSQRTKGSKDIPMMADLVTVVGEMAAAIRNPTHWSETLYSRVMEVEGFIEHVLEDVFDYLQERETEARKFMVKRLEMREAWVRKYLANLA